MANFLRAAIQMTIQSKCVTVVGIGRLGLCTALCMERSFFSLVGKKREHKLLSFFVRSRFLDDLLTVQICLAVNCHCRAGYDVVGVDVHQAYVDSLNDRSFASREPRVEEFLAGATRFHATTSIQEGVSHSDLIYVMVDTPSNGGEHHYDVRYVPHTEWNHVCVSESSPTLWMFNVQQIGTRVVQYQ